MKFLVINGPNLNLLGIREPDIYGKNSYAELCTLISHEAMARDVQTMIFQSNHEGAIVDKIQEAYYDKIDGIIINPAAYTHTSVAILDALKSVGIPAVEVHISKVNEREDFRQISYPGLACFAKVIGKGFDGYIEAMDILIAKLKA